MILFIFQILLPIQCTMLVETVFLLFCFGQVKTRERKLVEPLPYVKNLNQTQSSKNPTLPVSDLPETFSSQSYSKNCQKPVTQCFNSDQDVTCFGAKLPYSSSGLPLTNGSTADDWSGLSLVLLITLEADHPRCWALIGREGSVEY